MQTSLNLSAELRWVFPLLPHKYIVFHTMHTLVLYSGSVENDCQYVHVHYVRMPSVRGYLMQYAQFKHVCQLITWLKGKYVSDSPRYHDDYLGSNCIVSCPS